MNRLRSDSRLCFRLVLFVSSLLIATCPASVIAGAKEDAEAAKLQSSGARGYRSVLRQSTVDSEKEARRRLEEEARQEPPLSRFAAPPLRAEALPQQPAPSRSVEELLAAYDWERHLGHATPTARALRLTVSAPQAPFVYGSDYYLFLSLENFSTDAQVLDDMPACGSLARVDSLVFSFTSDDGSSLELANRYVDSSVVHTHGALTVAADGVVIDAASLSDLVATSGALFELIMNARFVDVAVEVPSRDLVSNVFRIAVEKP